MLYHCRICTCFSATALCIIPAYCTGVFSGLPVRAGWSFDLSVLCVCVFDLCYHPCSCLLTAHAMHDCRQTSLSVYVALLLIQVTQLFVFFVYICDILADLDALVPVCSRAYVYCNRLEWTTRCFLYLFLYDVFAKCSMC